MMNRIVLMGRLTRDPELRVTNSGVSTCGFSLAVDRAFKNGSGEQETDFIPIVVWRKQAENCATYLKKGSLVALEGRLQVRSYDDKEGQKRWVSEVVADNVRFVNTGKKEDLSASEDEMGVGGYSDDEIPF